MLLAFRTKLARIRTTLQELHVSCKFCLGLYPTLILPPGSAQRNNKRMENFYHYPYLKWIEDHGAEVYERGVLVQPACRGSSKVLPTVRAHSPGYRICTVPCRYLTAVVLSRPVPDLYKVPVMLLSITFFSPDKLKCSTLKIDKNKKHYFGSGNMKPKTKLLTTAPATQHCS